MLNLTPRAFSKIPAKFKEGSTKREYALFGTFSWPNWARKSWLAVFCKCIRSSIKFKIKENIVLEVCPLIITTFIDSSVILVGCPLIVVFQPIYGLLRLTQNFGWSLWRKRVSRSSQHPGSVSLCAQLRHAGTKDWKVCENNLRGRISTIWGLFLKSVFKFLPTEKKSVLWCFTLLWKIEVLYVFGF